MIEKRNKLILYRYIFYSNLTPRLAYDFIISILAEEFFLSPVTIPAIIKKKYDQLIKLRKQTTPLNELRKKYPFFEWDAKKLFN